MKFEDMKNTIIGGDSYELIKNIPDKSIDLILTDPPYEFHSGISEGGIFKNRLVVPHSDMKDRELLNGIDNKILDEFVRVMKHINIFIWCNKEQILGYLNFFANYDISFEILTWHKTNPTPLTNNTFLPDTEYCLYFREKGKVLLNDGYELKSKYYITSTNKEDKDNIIDLIEVGDYVNEERVIALKKDISERNIHMNSKGNSIFVDYDLANDWYYGIDDEEIKSIVTKEQFESMEYKVNE